MHSEKNEASYKLTPSSGRNIMMQLLAHKTYFFTSAVGLLAPLLIVFLYTSAASEFEAILFFVAVIISTIYLFYAFSQMLLTRFEFNQIRFATNLLFTTIGIYIGLTIVFMLFVGRHPQFYDPNNASLFDLVGYYGSVLAAFGLSTALIMMSFELEHLPDTLHGLLKPLRYALFLLSMFLILSTLATITSYLSKMPLILAASIVTMRLADILILLSLTITCILISLIFLFFAIRDVIPPVETD